MYRSKGARRRLHGIAHPHVMHTTIRLGKPRQPVENPTLPTTAT
jgi:hypothetical protein